MKGLNTLWLLKQKKAKAKRKLIVFLSSAQLICRDNVFLFLSTILCSKKIISNNVVMNTNKQVLQVTEYSQYCIEIIFIYKSISDIERIIPLCSPGQAEPHFTPVYHPWYSEFRIFLVHILVCALGRSRSQTSLQLTPQPPLDVCPGTRPEQN